MNYEGNSFNESNDFNVFNQNEVFSDFNLKDDVAEMERIDFTEDELVNYNNLNFNCSNGDQADYSVDPELPQVPDNINSDASVLAGASVMQEDVAIAGDVALVGEISGSSSVSDVDQSFFWGVPDGGKYPVITSTQIDNVSCGPPIQAIDVLAYTKYFIVSSNVKCHDGLNETVVFNSAARLTDQLAIDREIIVFLFTRKHRRS